MSLSVANIMIGCALASVLTGIAVYPHNQSVSARQGFQSQVQGTVSGSLNGMAMGTTFLTGYMGSQQSPVPPSENSGGGSSGS